MKIVGFCGSPREQGNTEYLINVVLGNLEKQGFETELVRLRDKKLEQCSGCYHCVKAKECNIDDDFSGLFQKMMEADAIILGSPVYHSSITPKLKALLDRAGFLGRWVANDMKAGSSSYQWKGSAFSGKVVAPVTVARRAGQNFAFAQLLLWASVNDTIIVSSNYWNVGVAGTAGKIDADQDAEGIGIMNHLADNMAFVLRQLKKA